MKKKNPTILSVIIAFFLLGCGKFGVDGNGILRNEERNLGEFDKIEISSPFDALILAGENENKVIVSGDDNLLKYVKTEVTGNTLKIYDEENINPREKMFVKIYVKSFSVLDASGAGEITVKNFNSEEFAIDASGAGSLSIDGKVKNLKVDASGAVEIKARDLISSNATIDMSGASNADIFAQETLAADLSGVGNINVYGNPKTVKKEISGLGSINIK